MFILTIYTLTVDDEHFSGDVIGNEWIWEELEESLQSATDGCLTETQAVDIQVMIYRIKFKYFKISKGGGSRAYVY